MEHFKVYHVKAQLLCLIFILSPVPINGRKVEGSLPDITTLFEMMRAFVSPYLSPQRNPDEPSFRTINDATIEKAIKEKIEKLKPLLQDDDVEQTNDDEESNNLTLEGKDETTIIEFVTSDKFKREDQQRANEKIKKQSDFIKGKLKKYKQIRQKIKAALKKENVSLKTKSLVTTTLDDMITRVFENQCPWKTTPGNNLNQSRKSLDNVLSTALEWKEKWDYLRQKYLKYGSSNEIMSPGAELPIFFDQFHEFLEHIVEDLQKLNEYKITCQFTKKKSAPTIDKYKLHAREGKEPKKIKKKHKCVHFKICSKELYTFMTDFYITLNDTVDSTLRNYASMYVRDVVVDDSEEKEIIVTVINNISNLAEYKINKIYKKETANLELNNNKDKDANIIALKNYIKNIIEKNKNATKKILETGLISLKSGPQIKNDLGVNLDVDLDNLGRDFKSRICSVFSLCNGKFTGRRVGGSHDDPQLKNRQSVYVKLQLNLDDELKDTIARTRSSVAEYKSRISKKTSKKEKYEGVRQTMMYRKFKGISQDFNKYPTFNITRTTLLGSNSTEIITTNIIKESNKSTTAIANEINTTVK